MVFKRSVPTAVTLLKDLEKCGIKGVDDQGRHLDFHALRHTFATLLASSGVAPRVAMELMRHSDMRLTAKTYTDSSLLPMADAVEKLPRYDNPKMISAPSTQRSVTAPSTLYLMKSTFPSTVKSSTECLCEFG